MVISSRTPEGTPHRCPVCKSVSKLESCNPGGDTVCPACGQLLWTIEHAIHQRTGVPRGRISMETRLRELESDSLGFVELVMEFEDELSVSIPDEEYEKLRTVGDLLRWARQQQHKAAAL